MIVLLCSWFLVARYLVFVWCVSFIWVLDALRLGVYLNLLVVLFGYVFVVCRYLLVLSVGVYCACVLLDAVLVGFGLFDCALFLALV